MSLFVDFNDSLPCGVCQCVVAGRPRCLAALTPAKPGDHRAGSVHPAAGPCGSELRTLIRMGVKIIPIITSKKISFINFLPIKRNQVQPLTLCI